MNPQEHATDRRDGASTTPPPPDTGGSHGGGRDTPDGSDNSRSRAATQPPENSEDGGRTQQDSVPLASSSVPRGWFWFGVLLVVFCSAVFLCQWWAEVGTTNPQVTMDTNLHLEGLKSAWSPGFIVPCRGRGCDTCVSGKLNQARFTD